MTDFEEEEKEEEEIFFQERSLRDDGKKKKFVSWRWKVRDKLDLKNCGKSQV